ASGIVNGRQVRALVFSGHLAGVVPVDSNCNPLRNLIIWLDERASGYPRELFSGLIRFKGYNLLRLLEFLLVTGGAPSKTGKDPISKILWIRDNEPDIWNKTFKFLGTNSFLLAKTTGNYVTSPDDASLTWLLDTRNFRNIWSLRLLRKYGIPIDKLPRIARSIDIAGRIKLEAAKELNIDPNIPVIVGSGDLTSAAVGSGAISKGELHIYVGTSDWIAGHIRERRVDLSHYIGSIPSAIPDMYLIIAEQEVAGAALDFIIEKLGLKGEYDTIENLVMIARPGSQGLIFTPWLYGERCPIDDPEARGALIGLSLAHRREDILRAVMEGVALNIKWAYTYIEKIVGFQNDIRIIGGGAKSDIWCQIIADSIDRTISRVSDPHHATMRGAAMIASLAVGRFKSFEEAAARLSIDKVFKPDIERVNIYNKIFKNYIETYSSLSKIFKSLANGF
ncbi:MAG: FGGY-family carbohydrate kinase, partial [Acidilobaceae archaeon]